MFVGLKNAPDLLEKSYDLATLFICCEIIGNDCLEFKLFGLWHRIWSFSFDSIIENFCSLDKIFTLILSLFNIFGLYELTCSPEIFEAYVNSLDLYSLLLLRSMFGILLFIIPALTGLGYGDKTIGSPEDVYKICGFWVNVGTFICWFWTFLFSNKLSGWFTCNTSLKIQ